MLHVHVVVPKTYFEANNVQYESDKKPFSSSNGRRVYWIDLIDLIGLITHCTFIDFNRLSID